MRIGYSGRLSPPPVQFGETIRDANGRIVSYRKKGKDASKKSSQGSCGGGGAADEDDLKKVKAQLERMKKKTNPTTPKSE